MTRRFTALATATIAAFTAVAPASASDTMAPVVGCAALTGLNFEGNTTVTAATL